jgi:PAS domain-containing protein
VTTSNDLQRLRASERRYRRLVELAHERLRFQATLLDAVGAVGQAVIAVDLEGRITYWNRAAEALYGWSEREALDRNARGRREPPPG